MDSSSANAASAETEPPVHLTDPYVRRLCVTRAVWARAMRGRIPKPADAAVARALGEYGNAKGENCHPGIERLSTDTCMSPSSVKRSVGWLAEHGWITRTAKSARKLGLADVWRCTIPATVALELGKWDMEANGDLWMNRPSHEPKRPGVRERPGPRKRGPRPKVVDLQGSETRVLGVKNSDVGVRNSGSRGQSCDPPPQSYVTTSSIKHHSESLTRPHADAWGDDEDQDEMLEWIIGEVEQRLGHALSPGLDSLVLGMLSRGANPKAVLNAAVTYEQECA